MGPMNGEKRPGDDNSGSAAEQLPASPQPSSMPQGTVSAAADLIKTLDSAFSSMNNNAVVATKGAEEARTNARTASQLVRLYQQPTFASVGLPASVRGMTQSEARLPGTPPSNASYADTNGVHTPYTPLTPTSNNKSRAGPLSPAEDVLSLSLELERTRQALADERTMHEDTKFDLERAESKNGEYKGQIEDMLEHRETEREKHDNIVQALETDLEAATQRADAAEEDAQQALDLARGNAESREQVEEWLQRALEEIQTLRAHIAQQQQLHDQPRGSFASSTSQSGGAEPNGDRPPPPHHHGAPSLETITEEVENDPSVAARPARALVAAGRELLQRSVGKEPMVVVPSPGDAAERRRRVKERLDSLSLSATSTDSSDRSTSPVPPINASNSNLSTPSTTATPPQHHLGTSVEALDICRRATRVLKESGRRLRLGGRWWSGSPHRHGPDELHLDAMARHYCIEVENLVDQKRKEIVELESLCTLWESGATSSTNGKKN